MLLAKSVTQGNVASVSPSWPLSSRATSRLRMVSTATQGMPSTVIGTSPPEWPAGCLLSDVQVRFPVLVEKAIRFPSSSPTSTMTQSP